MRRRGGGNEAIAEWSGPPLNGALEQPKGNARGRVKGQRPGAAVAPVGDGGRGPATPPGDQHLQGRAAVSSLYVAEYTLGSGSGGKRTAVLGWWYTPTSL